MEMKSDYSLSSYNTFNIKVDGKFFTEVASLAEINEASTFAKQRELPLLILGGGSNVLFTADYPGLVMRVNFKGIHVLKETPDAVTVQAGAGVPWDDLVAWSVHHGFGGLENLSLIPGSVGASPVQNIGAYGVEMQDHFVSLDWYDLESGKVIQFNKKEAAFGYRNSIFKQKLKGRGVVLSVTFSLSKKHTFKTGYGTLGERLKEMGAATLTLKAMRDAVISIRRSKLPDPEVIGNAGSFFKNPTVPQAIHELLAREHPGLVSYPQSRHTFKLAAGWLIDQCGWKGYREGDAGVHEKQALVLVNYNNASGQEIFNLSEKIHQSVMNRFHVELEREVNVI